MRFEQRIQETLDHRYNNVFQSDIPGLYYRVLPIRLIGSTFSPFEVIDLDYYGIDPDKPLGENIAWGWRLLRLIQTYTF